MKFIDLINYLQNKNIKISLVIGFLGLIPIIDLEASSILIGWLITSSNV